MAENWQGIYRRKQALVEQAKRQGVFASLPENWQRLLEYRYGQENLTNRALKPLQQELGWTKGQRVTSERHAFAKIIRTLRDRQRKAKSEKNI